MISSVQEKNNINIDTTTDAAIDYVNNLINRSQFRSTIEYIEKTKLPIIKFAQIRELSIFEPIIKLMIYQGYHKKALIILERVKDRLKTLPVSRESQRYFSSIMYWRGIIAQTLKEKFDKYFTECFNLAKDLPEYPELQSRSYLGLSFLTKHINHRENFLNKALKLAKKSMSKDRNLNLYQEANILNNLGIYFGLIGDFELSKTNFNQCIKLAQEIGDQRRLAGTLINYSNTNFLSESAGSKDPAIILIGRNMLQKSVKICERIESLEYAQFAHNSLAEYYQKKRPKLSLKHLSTVCELQLKRELLNADQAEKILSLMSPSNINTDIAVFNF